MFKKIQDFASSTIGKIRRLISSAGESLLMKRFADKSERAFVRDFSREAMPMLIFIACVYGLFGLLGFIEELLTITILAAFAWCAKMEKHYSGRASVSYRKEDGVPPWTQAAGRDEIIRLAEAAGYAFGKDIRQKASIVVSIFTEQKRGGMTRFYISAFNCPGYESFHKLYNFTKIPELFRDVAEIITAEMKSRSAKISWHLNWEGDHTMEYKSMLAGGYSTPASFHKGSSAAVMLLTSMYFWHLIRHRYKYLGWLVRHIGQSTGKILYFFYQGETVARKMRQGEQPRFMQ